MREQSCAVQNFAIFSIESTATLRTATHRLPSLVRLRRLRLRRVRSPLIDKASFGFWRKRFAAPRRSRRHIPTGKKTGFRPKIFSEAGQKKYAPGQAIITGYLGSRVPSSIFVIFAIFRDFCAHASGGRLVAARRGRQRSRPASAAPSPPRASEPAPHQRYTHGRR